MKKRLIKGYIHNRALLGRGNLELAFFTSYGHQVILIWLFVRDLFQVEKKWAVYFIPIYFVVKLALEWGLGQFFLRSGIIESEKEWIETRNPVVTKILAAVTRKDERKNDA